MTINAFRRPSKSDKIEPRRHPATLEIAHKEAGEVVDMRMMLMSVAMIAEMKLSNHTY